MCIWIHTDTFGSLQSLVIACMVWQGHTWKNCIYWSHCVSTRWKRRQWSYHQSKTLSLSVKFSSQALIRDNSNCGAQVLPWTCYCIQSLLGRDPGSGTSVVGIRLNWKKSKYFALSHLSYSAVLQFWQLKMQFQVFEHFQVHLNTY